MYRRRHHASGDIPDLDLLESRGAAFVKTSPRDEPRHSISSAATARAEHLYHSRFSGEGYFGLSAYGIILIATLLLLIILFYASILLVSYIYSRFL